jgi:predicted amidohydrolase
LSVVVEQTAPARLEVERNAEEARAAVARGARGGADLVVLPELALTGYDLGRWAAELASDVGVTPLPGLVDGPVTVVGFPERHADGRVYNAVGALRGERFLHVHRKRYLPTYGMFDEGRLFAPGRSGPRLIEPWPGWPTALLVCEELWHPALPYLAAVRGASLLVVVAAGPGRGVLEPGEESRFASTEAWTLLARATALAHGIWLVLCNRAGVEGGVTFAGSSVIVAPDGSVIARGRSDGPDRLSARLDPARVLRARSPYSHLRDEDPRLVLDELRELLSGGPAGPVRTPPVSSPGPGGDSATRAGAEP